jgi:hypothetical protein
VFSLMCPRTTAVPTVHEVDTITENHPVEAQLPIPSNMSACVYSHAGSWVPQSMPNRLPTAWIAHAVACSLRLSVFMARHGHFPRFYKTPTIDRPQNSIFNLS